MGKMEVEAELCRVLVARYLGGINGLLLVMQDLGVLAFLVSVLFWALVLITLRVDRRRSFNSNALTWGFAVGLLAFFAFGLAAVWTDDARCLWGLIIGCVISIGLEKEGHVMEILFAGVAAANQAKAAGNIGPGGFFEGSYRHVKIQGYVNSDASIRTHFPKWH